MGKPSIRTYDDPQTGEKIAYDAKATHKTLRELLVSGCTETLERAMKRGANNASSIRICTALTLPISDVAGYAEAYLWIEHHLADLITTIQGHRFVEAVLRSPAVGEHFAERVADHFFCNGIVPDSTFSSRVASCCVLHHFDVTLVHDYAAALAQQADRIFQHEPDGVIYNLCMLARMPCAKVTDPIIKVWTMENAMKKLVSRRRCYMKLLLACLQSDSSAKQRLVAMLMAALEGDDRDCLVAACLRTRPLGTQVLEEIFTQASQIYGVITTISEPPNMAVVRDCRFPSAFEVDVWIARHTPSPTSYEVDQTWLGSSLAVRLAAAKYGESLNDTPETPSLLYSCTPESLD